MYKRQEKIVPESDDSEPDKSDSDSSSSSDQPSSDSEWESFPNKKKDSVIKPHPEEITIDDLIHNLNQELHQFQEVLGRKFKLPEEESHRILEIQEPQVSPGNIGEEIKNHVDKTFPPPRQGKFYPHDFLSVSYTHLTLPTTVIV